MRNKALQFDQEMKIVVKRERELLAQVIQQIQECDRHRYYLALGYSNLFLYLTQEVGYSEGSAQRRIDAARLMREIPELYPQIESGKINLKQISLIQQAARQKIKSGDTPGWTNPSELKELKSSLLCEISHKNQRESESYVAKAFDLKIESRLEIHTQKDDSVRLQLTLSKEQAEKLKQVQESLSHLVPDGNLVEVLDHLMTQHLTHKRAATVAVKAATELARPTNKTLTPRTRKIILRRDRSCQFVSPLTGKQCASRWQLQVDHVQPQWAGGGHESENLQAFCAAHNRHKYRREAKIRVLGILP